MSSQFFHRGFSKAALQCIGVMECLLLAVLLPLQPAMAYRTPPGSACPADPRQPYRSPSVSTVFYVTDACQKRPVFNPDVYFSHFADWSDVVFLEQYEIDSIPDDPLNFLPWGPRRTFENNSIVKITSDPRVYLLEDGVAYPFEDETAFTSLGFTFDQVEDVTEEVMAKFQKRTETIRGPENAPLPFIFRYEGDSKVYVLKSENGSIVKSHIQSMEDLRKIARADRIGVVPSGSILFPDAQATGSSSSAPSSETPVAGGSGGTGSTETPSAGAGSGSGAASGSGSGASSGGGGGGGGGSSNPTPSTPVADTTAPTITVFTLPATANSLTVSISAFTATDGTGVTGYLLTETDATPSASGSSWSATAPTTHTFSSEGTRALYAWAKDAAGNVSARAGDEVVITLPSADTTSPTISAFTLPATASSLTVSIASLNATDGVAVTGYYLSESNTTPSASAVEWSSSAPSSYVFPDEGTRTLYVWVKDGAGNISERAQASVMIALMDSIPPVISLVASSTSMDTATITWITDEASTSTVQYGTTVSYGSASSSETLAVTHSMTLTGLIAGTVYHFRITCRDAYGNIATTGDYSFIMLSEEAPVDSTAPTISAFTLPDTSPSLTVSIASLSATDNVAVTGYYVSESSTAPSPTAIGWSSSAPSFHVFSEEGTGTLYLWAKDLAGNVSSVASASTLIAIPDTNSPVISSLASSTSMTSATITWVTDEASTSTVQYGTTISYGSASSSIASRTSHSIVLTGLSSDTIYHFRIASSDALGNVTVTQDYTFRTLSPSAGALPTNARIAYLHHSTGGVVWEGGVDGWVSSYNAENDTSYAITEQSFPKSSPYGWQNYAYDYWNIWVNHAGETAYLEEPTLEMLTDDYDVIVWKHCYPGANVSPDTGSPNVASGAMTDENYRLQYNALKEKMHEFPNNRFIVWTLAANVAANTSAGDAARARDFVEWVTDEWDEPGDNIFVWDFFELETEGGNMLLPAYAASAGDSHPNHSPFAVMAAPLFGQRLVDVIEGRGDDCDIEGKGVCTSSDTTAPSVSFTNPAGGATVTGSVTLAASASDNDAVSHVRFWVDGTLLSTDASAPYAYVLNTSLYATGTHTLSAVATDASGNAATSTQTVTIGSGVSIASSEFNIGMNLPDLNYWTEAAPYVDMARMFCSNAESVCWSPIGEDGPAPVDALGYPTVPAGSAMWSPYPTGTYTVTWDGAGSVEFTGIDSEAFHITESSGGHTTGTLDFVAGTYLGLIVTPSVSNLHIISPASEYEPGNTFRTNYLRRLQPFSTLRMMDALKTNLTQMTNWSERSWPQAFSSAKTNGMPYEEIIALANESGKDVWINVPTFANDQFVCKLARLFRYGEPGSMDDSEICDPSAPGNPPEGAVALDPNLKLYVEYGNETWNYAFQNTDELFCMTNGMPDDRFYGTPQYDKTCSHTEPTSALGAAALADASFAWDEENPWAKAAQYNGLMVWRNSDVFKTVFASNPDAVKIVLAGQGAGVSDGTLVFLEAKYGPANQYIDVLSYAPYIDDLNDDDEMPIVGSTQSEQLTSLFANLNTSLETRATPWTEAGKELADRFQLELNAYEGGQGLFGNTHYDLKLAAQDDPRMYDLTRSTLQRWNEITGPNTLFTYYTMVMGSGPWGFWGALTDAETQPGSQKWDAILSLVMTPGDADLSGTVDATDLAIIQAHFGQTGMWWEQGDFNHDGTVNQLDLDLYDANVGVPTVALSTPLDGATVTSTISIAATASDNNAVAHVRFWIDGTLLATDASAPYAHALNTSLYENGSHTLSAVATDASGNAATSTIAVTIANESATWEIALSKSSLPGLQSNANCDGSRAWVFANMLRSAEAWILGNGDTTSTIQNATTLQIDENGWPLALPANTRLRMGPGLITAETTSSTSSAEESTYLRGVYVLTWEGTGDVELDASEANGIGYQTLRSESNRVVFQISADNKHPMVWVRSSDPNDHVRNMKLWAPEYDGAGLSLTSSSDLDPGHIVGSLEPAPGEPEPFWHPLYLEHLREETSGVLRFMDWLSINEGESNPNPVATTADDLANPEYAFGSFSAVAGDLDWDRYPIASYNSRVGLPYEWLIDLCNTVGKDCWIQVPHTADEALIRKVARLVAGEEPTSPGLDPNLRVWFEYSNEIWNPVVAYMPQVNKALEVAATHFGVSVDQIDPIGEQHAWGSGYLQGQALQVFEDEWRHAGQSDDRLINVVAGFAANTAFNQATIDAVQEIDPNLPEVFAITNYFGASTQWDIYSLHEFGPHAPGEVGVWPADLYDRTKAVVRRNLLDTTAAWRANVSLASAEGLPLVAYEGGQHLLPLGFGDWNNPAHVDFMRFMESFQDSEQMGDLYKEMYALWSAMGGRTASEFVDITGYAFWGYWGAKRLLTQTREDAPKWDAGIWWGDMQAGVRDPSEPLGTRPALTAETFNGEAGQTFSVEIEASGGEGSVALTHLAGDLPPGLTFASHGSGSALITGTPTAYGSYQIVVRARDADGDVDDEVFGISVDPSGTTSNAFVVFRGEEIPGTPTAGENEWEYGRYDSMRSYTTDADAERMYVPFSLADGSVLYRDESADPGHAIPATSQLTIYGGLSVERLPFTGDDIPEEDRTTFTPGSSPTAIMHLRNGAFRIWNGDGGAPTETNLFLAWRRDQFTEYATGTTFTFGSDPETATLRVDLVDMNSGSPNEIRFAVLNHDGDGTDRWYISEVAYTQDVVADGYFQIQDFSASGEAGKRWSAFTPTEENFDIPTSELTYVAKDFTDVQAVGLLYNTSRDRWHYGFGFDRFIALGERIE